MVEVIASYRTLVGVAVGCGLVIAGFFESTRAPIAANRAAMLQTAIDTVLPGSIEIAPLVMNRAAVLEETEDALVADAYLARDSNGEVVGFAIPATGVGYQDRIRLLWGFDPRRQQLTGYVVLENRETPGLGARIATDPAFLAQFREVQLLEGEGSIGKPPLTVVPTGTARTPGEIDALTGATVSTRAVVDIVNRSISQWLPLLTADEARN